MKWKAIHIPKIDRHKCTHSDNNCTFHLKFKDHPDLCSCGFMYHTYIHTYVRMRVCVWERDSSSDCWTQLEWPTWSCEEKIIFILASYTYFASQLLSHIREMKIFVKDAQLLVRWDCSWTNLMVNSVCEVGNAHNKATNLGTYFKISNPNCKHSTHQRTRIDQFAR